MMASPKGQIDPRSAIGFRRWAKRQYNRWLRRKAKKEPDQPTRREYKGYD